jgi:hypothetical protein
MESASASSAASAVAEAPANPEDEQRVADDDTVERVKELADVISHVRLDLLSDVQKKALAGLFAQAVSSSLTPQLHAWGRGFFFDLCINKLQLPEAATRGLAPLLGSKPQPVVSNWQQQASPFLEDIGATLQERFRKLLDLLVLYVTTDGYDARVRSVFVLAARLAGLNYKRLGQYEDALVARLQADVMASQLESQVGSHSKHGRATSLILPLTYVQATAAVGAKKADKYRWVKIGAAAVAGAGLLFATGGIAAIAAAPTLIPIIASLGATGSAAAAFFSTSAGVLMFSSIFGAAGAGLGSYHMHRRTGGLSVFQFLCLSDPSSASAIEDGLASPSGSATSSAPAAADEADSGEEQPPAPASAAAPSRFSKALSSAVKVITSPQRMLRSASARDAAAPSAADDDSLEPEPTPRGLHTFILVSGLLVEEGLADFWDPWGGLTANATAGPVQEGVALEDAGSSIINNEAAAAMTASAPAPSSLSSPLDGVLFGSRVALVPAGPADRAAVYWWSVLSKGAVAWPESWSPATDAGPPSEIEFLREWPEEWFTGSGSAAARDVDMGRVYLITVPRSEVWRYYKASASPTSPAKSITSALSPSGSVSDREVIPIGFVAVSPIRELPIPEQPPNDGDDDAPQSTAAAPEEPVGPPRQTELRVIIGHEEFWSHGLGPEALMVVMSRLAFDPDSAVTSFLFQPPQGERGSRAVLAAEKVGFAVAGSPFLGGVKHFRMEASRGSLLAKLEDGGFAVLDRGKLKRKSLLRESEATEVDAVSVQHTPLTGISTDRTVRHSFSPSDALAAILPPSFVQTAPTTPPMEVPRASTSAGLNALVDVGVSLRNLIVPLQPALTAVSELGTYSAGSVESPPGWFRKMVPYGDVFTLVYEPDVSVTTA